MTGLGEEWSNIITTLSKLSSYYRELNNTISFGLDMKIRREAIEKSLKAPRIVLDLGSGDGCLTEIVVERFPHISLVVMLDVLPEMLRKARRIQNVERVQAVFEYLPFRRSVFDHVLAAFSLRDALNLEKALDEIDKVLADHGRLIVIDLGKPDNCLKRFLTSFYWTVIAPIYAFIRLGSKGLVSMKIRETLKSYPTTRRLLQVYDKYFRQVKLVEKFIGFIIVIEASKSLV